MKEPTCRPLAVIAILALLGGAGQPLEACRICLPLPKESIADLLIESESAVLAREDPERPFHFVPVEILKGKPPKERIGLLLDSVTRRLLKAYPHRSVLLAKAGTWQRVAAVDKTVRPVIDEILERSATWTHSEDARFEYFSKLFAHEHPVLRTLAHLEVARAPYGRIRKLGRHLDRATIRAPLEDARLLEWWALHILLLAQSNDPRDRRQITETIRSLETFSDPLHLGAWATAYIEIEGEKAIQYLEARYFRRAPPAKQLRRVLMALSVQGASGRTELRDRIVASYKVAIEQHPGLTSPVLDDLIAWKRVELIPYMQAFGAKHARTLAPDARLKLNRFTRLR